MRPRVQPHECVSRSHHRSAQNPVGYVDPGESDVEAALREAREETGLENVAVVKQCCTYTNEEQVYYGAVLRNKCTLYHAEVEMDDAQADAFPCANLQGEITHRFLLSEGDLARSTDTLPGARFGLYIHHAVAMRFILAARRGHAFDWAPYLPAILKSKSSFNLE